MALVGAIGKQALEQQAQMMMQCFLQLFHVKAAETYETVFMAIGTLASTLGAAFIQWMPQFSEILKAGLANIEEHTVCLSAVGVIGDLCRALEGQVMPFCDDIMLQLMRNLIDQSLHRSVKPPILSCFGDIALALNADFGRFLETSMTMLFNASKIQMDMSDPDDNDYMITLHENIIEGYSGIVQALSHCQRAELLQPHLPNICGFLETIIVQQLGEARDPGVTKAAINLTGDLAQGLKGAVKPYFQKPWVTQLLQSAQAADCVEDATWAHSEIQKM